MSAKITFTRHSSGGWQAWVGLRCFGTVVRGLRKKWGAITKAAPHDHGEGDTREEAALKLPGLAQALKRAQEDERVLDHAPVIGEVIGEIETRLIHLADKDDAKYERIQKATKSDTWPSWDLVRVREHRKGIEDSLTEVRKLRDRLAEQALAAADRKES